MRKHGGTPFWRDKHVTLAAIGPPGVARGRFVWGQQSGLAGGKPPPLFTRGASSCSSQGRRRGEPWGASPRPSAPTYLSTLGMTMNRPLDGLRQVEYLKEFGDIYKRPEKHLEPVLVNKEQWKRDKTYLWHEDRIVLPSNRIPALLKWTHDSSGLVVANSTLRPFMQWFHSTWTDDQLRKTLQPIVDKCPCRSCRPGDIRDRGLYSTLPIPHCANTEMPKFRGYDVALVVTCGLTRFTRVFRCTKHITGEETIKILLEEWFGVYGAPKEIKSDEDVRVRSDTGWYKRVLRSLNVQVSTGIPYTHTSNPLCERQIRVLKENVRIWCKTERTKD